MKLTAPGRVILALLLACAVAVGALVTTAAASPSPSPKAPVTRKAPPPSRLSARPKSPASRGATPLSAIPSDAQCQNGRVGPPLVTTPCLNGTLGTTTYAGWTRGNVNETDAHWAEGDFVPYRVAMPSLAAGDYTLLFDYSTTVFHGGQSLHAFDYLGNYDATETTEPVSTPTHRNNSNPCYDVLTAGGCTAPGTPPAPVSTIDVPPADLSGQRTACQARGLSTVPPQTEGHFSLFAPSTANARFTDVRYVDQNHTEGVGNNCATRVELTFHLDAPGDVVLAFGAHIATVRDWGRGNVAAGTQASFNVDFMSLNGLADGLGDLTLHALAVAPHPDLETYLSQRQVTAGNQITDLAATVAGAYGQATGHVQFRLCGDVTTGCPQGTGTPIGSPVPLANERATSVPFGHDLPAGHYCVGVDYLPDGDSFYSDDYYDGPGECFTINKAEPSINTHLYPNPVGVGQRVHDTATLSGATSDATGTVEFHRYPNLAACEDDTAAFPGRHPSSATLVSSHTVTGSTVGPSANLTFSQPGQSYWAAFYSGDNRNVPAASICQTEPLVVQLRPASILTNLIPNAGAVGEPIYDTAELAGAYVDAAGTVQFRHYDSLAACEADTAGFPPYQPSRGTHAGTAPVVGGTAGPSGTARFPRPGLHWWAAFYSGDGIHAPVASDCASEPVAVTEAGPALTVVKTASRRGFDAAGVVITYYYRVTNVGPVPLHDITVTDSRGLPVSCPATALAPLEGMTCTARHRTTAADTKSGGITNTGTAEGTAPDGRRVRGRSTLRLPFTGLPPVPVTG